jgi:hypothetical protein
MHYQPLTMQVDKTRLLVTALDDDADERAYWLSQSPQKRLLALEQMRQIIYGYDPSTIRLQRILTIAEHP